MIGYPDRGSARETLLWRLEQLFRAFKTETGMKETEILEKAGLNRNFLTRSRQTGGRFNVSSYDRVALWFRRNWPLSLPWPNGVPVPAEFSAPP